MIALFFVQWPIWYRDPQTIGLWLTRSGLVSKYVLAYSVRVDKAANILNGGEDEF